MVTLVTRVSRGQSSLTAREGYQQQDFVALNTLSEQIPSDRIQAEAFETIGDQSCLPASPPEDHHRAHRTLGRSLPTVPRATPLRPDRWANGVRAPLRAVPYDELCRGDGTCEWDRAYAPADGPDQLSSRHLRNRARSALPRPRPFKDLEQPLLYRAQQPEALNFDQLPHLQKAADVGPAYPGVLGERTGSIHVREIRVERRSDPARLGGDRLRKGSHRYCRKGFVLLWCLTTPPSAVNLIPRECSTW